MTGEEEPLVVITVDEGQRFLDDPAAAANARQVQTHLQQHLTDGRWHDDCKYCLERRSKGGTGVRPQ